MFAHLVTMYLEILVMLPNIAEKYVTTSLVFWPSQACISVLYMQFLFWNSGNTSAFQNTSCHAVSCYCHEGCCWGSFWEGWQWFRMFPTLSFGIGWWCPKMAGAVGKLKQKFGVFASIPGYQEMHLESKNVQGSWQVSCVHLWLGTWSSIGWTLVSQKSTLAHRC